MIRSGSTPISWSLSITLPARPLGLENEGTLVALAGNGLRTLVPTTISPDNEITIDFE